MPPAATTDFGSDNTRLAPIPSTFVLLFARLAALGETHRFSIRSIVDDESRWGVGVS